MKKFFSACLLLLLFACGGNNDHSAVSPMAAPVDTRDQQTTEIHENVWTKSQVIPLIDETEVIASQINEGKMPYVVGNKIDGFIETTTYFTDENKEKVGKVKLIGVGNNAAVYFLKNAAAVFEQNDFIYVFEGEELMYVMTNGEAVVGISETSEKNIWNQYQTAKKVAEAALQNPE